MIISELILLRNLKEKYCCNSSIKKIILYLNLLDFVGVELMVCGVLSICDVVVSTFPVVTVDVAVVVGSSFLTIDVFDDLSRKANVNRRFSRGLCSWERLAGVAADDKMPSCGGVDDGVVVDVASASSSSSFSNLFDVDSDLFEADSDLFDVNSDLFDNVSNLFEVDSKSNKLSDREWGSEENVSASASPFSRRNSSFSEILTLCTDRRNSFSCRSCRYSETFSSTVFAIRPLTWNSSLKFWLKFLVLFCIQNNEKLN